MITHESQELSNTFQAIRNRPSFDILYLPGVTFQTVPADDMSQKRYGGLEQVTLC